MSSQSGKKVNNGGANGVVNRRKKSSADSNGNGGGGGSGGATKPLLGSKSAGSSVQSSKNARTSVKAEPEDQQGSEAAGTESADPSKNGGGLFRPLVVLALPGRSKRIALEA